jgi:hypothetical protein
MPVAEDKAPEAGKASTAVPELTKDAPEEEGLAELDPDWLENHQREVWQGLASLWHQPGGGFAIQAACNGDDSLGYACLRDQGNWSKIKRLGLPVVLVLQREPATYLLLHGMRDDRLLVGASAQLRTISKQAVESRWLGAYLVAWPQAPGWPVLIARGDQGSAVATVLDMAGRVEEPYYGEPVFDSAFELWLKDFQSRSGLEADGIVGRNTLLHLMTASIEDPQLLQAW